MPFVEEEDLVKLYNEIENLSKKEEELRKGYIDLKLLNNKITNNRKFRVVVILLLVIVALFLTYLAYIYKKEAKEQFTKEIVLKKKLDSLVNNVTNTTSKDIDTEENGDVTQEKPIFSIQIGTFKKLKIHPSTVKGGLKKIINKDSSYTYTIGEFSDFKEALVFRAQIQNLGIKDAFMVAYYKGEKISLKRALQLNKKKSN